MKIQVAKVLLGTLGLTAATLAAYSPALRGDFLWDDDKYVVENPALRSTEGLKRIWIEPGATPQFYPLVFSTFWIEYRLWGLDPAGYHVVNVFLHAANACLLWLVLTRLGVRGAGLAAAVFALHPMHVESVAWITERKNVLSGFFYLSAMVVWLHVSRVGDGRKLPVCDLSARHSPVDWPRYAALYLLFAAALLSKTVTCTFPLVALAILTWKRRRVGTRDVIVLTPMLAVGLAAGLFTAYFEKRYVGAEASGLSLVEHFLLAARVFWFYPWKLVWPADLTFIYPRWEVSITEWHGWAALLGIAAAIVTLWRLRVRVGLGPAAALAAYAVTISPALGFVHVYPMRFSWVADHFAYLASVPVIAVLIVVARRVVLRVVLRQSEQIFRWHPLGTCVFGLILVTLAVQTWGHATTYVRGRVLWEDTLEKNPSAWIAHNNLGVILKDEGDLERAVQHFREAIRLRPDLPEPHNNLGMAYALEGNLEAAREKFSTVLSLAPDHFAARYNLATGLLRAERWADALDHYRVAVRVRPGSTEARYGLGLALRELGSIDEAAAAFREVLRIEPAHRGAADALKAITGRSP